MILNQQHTSQPTLSQAQPHVEYLRQYTNVCDPQFWWKRLRRNDDCHKQCLEPCRKVFGTTLVYLQDHCEYNSDNALKCYEGFYVTFVKRRRGKGIVYVEDYYSKGISNTSLNIITYLDYVITSSTTISTTTIILSSERYDFFK